MSIAATMANAIVNTQLKISLTGDVFSSGFFGSISSVVFVSSSLFKLKDEAPADEKLAAMNSFKAAIEALPAKISVIRKIEVGLNINPAEAWSIALYSEFDTLDDVKYYATHPDHVAAGKLIAAVKESRACVDYEIIEN